jgi:hypothetical protein
MIPTLRILGLAALIVAALCMIASSTAAAGTLDIGADPAVLNGVSEGEQRLTVKKQTPEAGGEFSALCQSAAFEGTVEQDGSGSQQTEEATITPTFGNSESTSNGCQLFGQQAQVRLNGCKYTLTGAGQPANTFLVDIVGCTAGKQITFQAASCQLAIPEQNGLSHVVTKTLGGSPAKATFESTLSGITHSQAGGACPDGSHHGTNVSLSGSAVVEARENGESKQATVKGHQYQRHTVGEGTGFEIGSVPATITGQSEPKEGVEFEFSFTIPQGAKIQVTCNSAAFEATTQGKIAGEMTITPTYGKPGGFPASGCFSKQLAQFVIKMNGCKFTLTNAGQPTNTFLVDIVGCTAGKQIQLQYLICTFEVPEQNGISHVVASDLPEGEVTLESTMSGMTIRQAGVNCPNGNGSVQHNLAFTANTVVKAFEDAEGVSVFKHSHEYVENANGEQVSLSTVQYGKQTSLETT